MNSSMLHMKNEHSWMNFIHGDIGNDIQEIF
jgi:hypothetical protein